MLARADLHIHTVLSPCGDLEMSPGNILRAARERGLDLIGITDHNSTRQAGVIEEWGKEMGVAVLTGADDGRGGALPGVSADAGAAGGVPGVS